MDMNMFSKLIAEHQKRMRKMTLEATQLISPQIRKLRRSTINVPNIVRDAMVGLNETFQKIAKGLEETEEDIKIFRSAIVKLGYPPNGSIGIPNLRSIAQDYDIYGEEYVQEYIDEFMVNYYDGVILREMLLIWEGYSFIEKRLPLLRNAIKAHNLKMFELVVPSVISQLEGIVIDAFEIRGKVNGQILEILLEYLFIENNKEERFNFFDKSIYDYYINKVLVTFEHGYAIKSDISRHAILHGGDTKFGEETVSLKAILLLDSLIEAISELRDDVKQLARQEVKQYRKNRSKWIKNKLNKR
ncbi:hypothetical protein P5663_16255 [Priestia flexa]|uniref:hypothetical protein n=1 Tax=Priestia flexa TaxID=86664 RepID=UPI00240D4175|nr:hypothetical protein [Priestia flexa]WEZ07571.1 hypothetical protein P5663_16255 [Priestia flexa]